MTTIALIGNPNCGKTTLFNILTGARQKIGNWPGVTVERKSGQCILKGLNADVIDLPGIYSLTQSDITALDEQVAYDFLAQGQADIVVNILDASHLERHLYLTTQLLEMGLPVIVALNMMDVAAVQQITIDTKALSQRLHCPVVVLEARKNKGIPALQKAIQTFASSNAMLDLPYHPVLKNSIQTLQSFSPKTGLIIRLLENDRHAVQAVNPETILAVQEAQQHIQQTTQEEADILLADARYQFIDTLAKQSMKRGVITSTWTKKIDQIVLNRMLGIPIFLSVMYMMFFFAMNIGGVFQNFFDMASQTIFVDGLAYGLMQLGMPHWLIALLANGFGKGINTTITFVPILAGMFLFLSFLEDSGYMARAAFVVDRFMRTLGLPGKAFVPMIVGFGCNVPAVMGARTLENKRDRILTIMMSPFMSCGARLAIYAVFTAAFFQHNAQNIVFALYMIGITVAILTGFILRKTVLGGSVSPLVMELPTYHIPQLKTLLLHTWQRLKGFVIRAGRLIVPICVLLGTLNTITLNGTIITAEADTHSLLSILGHWITPIFAPMGIHPSNWPASVGLLTGVLAKEVVVGTLNTLYSQMGHLSQISMSQFDLWQGLKLALASIPDNIKQLSQAFYNPILAQAPISQLNEKVYGLMSQQFDGKIGAFAYLLFVLLYFPCVSTLAAMLRELHRGWSLFSAFWMTMIAYGIAVMFYQTATCLRHPLSSAIWIFTILSTYSLIFYSVYLFAGKNLYVAMPSMATQGENA